MKKIGKKYIIYSNGQRISVTDEHEILTNDGWKRADELVVGDDVIFSTWHL